MEFHHFMFLSVSFVSFGICAARLSVFVRFLHRRHRIAVDLFVFSRRYEYIGNGCGFPQGISFDVYTRNCFIFSIQTPFRLNYLFARIITKIFGDRRIYVPQIHLNQIIHWMGRENPMMTISYQTICLPKMETNEKNIINKLLENCSGDWYTRKFEKIQAIFSSFQLYVISVYV